MITRKCYVAMAKAIRDSGLSKANRDVAIRALSKVLREDNPLYNEYMFRNMANTIMDGDVDVDEDAKKYCSA